MLIDEADFEAKRALPAYRAGIWCERIGIAAFLLIVVLRVVGVLPGGAGLGLGLTAVLVGTGVASVLLFNRVAVSYTTSDGELVRRRPPQAMIYRDVFGLGRRDTRVGHRSDGPAPATASVTGSVTALVARPVEAAQPGPAAAVSGGWSIQPPRREGRVLSKRLLLGLAGVVVVLAGLGALVVRFAPTRGEAVPSVPDLRPLLVSAPDDAVPCPQDNTMTSVADLGHANAIPGGVLPLLRDSGLLGVAVRCWMVPGQSTVEVRLLRFDTPAHAAQIVGPTTTRWLKTVRATNIGDIPGVPDGHTFTLPAEGDQVPQLSALGRRADTAFMILGAVSMSFDTTAADRIAKQQYDRLPA